MKIEQIEKPTSLIELFKSITDDKYHIIIDKKISKHKKCFVSYDNDKIAVFLFGSIREESHFHIDFFYVLPEYRGNAYSGEFLKFLSDKYDTISMYDFEDGDGKYLNAIHCNIQNATKKYYEISKEKIIQKF